MKNSFIVIIISLSGIIQAQNGLVEKSENPEVVVEMDKATPGSKEDVKITNLLFQLLKNECPKKRWCKTYPGGSVCDSFYKELVKNPWVEGSYFIEEEEHSTTFTRFYIDRNPKNPAYKKDGQEIVPVNVHIWKHGKKNIERFDQELGTTTDLSKFDDPNAKYFDPSADRSFNDSHTVCHADSWVDYNGIPTKMYRCHMKPTFQEFITQINALKSHKSAQ